VVVRWAGEATGALSRSRVAGKQRTRPKEERRQRPEGSLWRMGRQKSTGQRVEAGVQRKKPPSRRLHVRKKRIACYPYCTTCAVG
jgi:hypothetical protein